MKDIFAEPKQIGKDLAAYPHFERRYLRAIELALRTAWSDLHKDVQKKNQLSTAKEEGISHLLRDALNKLREKKKGGIKEYNCLVFERPHVGAEFVTKDEKIRKPDIVFALCGWARPGVSDSMKDGIFVECKILECGSGKNVAAYCNKGIHRFVEGSYAERMQEGMMVAYVRSGQSLPKDLSTALMGDQMKDHLATDGKLSPCELTQEKPRVYFSTHERNWSYPNNEGYPGPIVIRHLWLHI